MRKNLQYKILTAVMALSVANWALPANALAGEDSNGNYNVTYDGETVNGNYNTVNGNGHSFTINGGDIDAVYGASSDKTSATNNKVYITDCINISVIYGGSSDGNSADSNAVYISGGSVGYVYGGESESGEVHHNTVNINSGSVGSVHGGDSTSSKAYNNAVNISGGSVGYVYGGSSNDGEAYDNTVIISGGSVSGDVYGGYINDNVNNNTIDNNEIIISGSANITNANLYGYGIGTNSSATGSNNTLTLNGWSGSVKGVYNFSDIYFNTINWDSGGTVLNITENTETDSLANTNINIKGLNFAGGAELNAGESMTIISNNDLGKDLGIGTGTGKVEALSNFTAGVAIEGTGTAEVASDGNSFKYTLTKVKHTDQIDLVAENRAVAAAFVNQGTDLISDSLDTISRDDNYGVKTFAAVHGNRSKYDVNSDIKINGWSVIAGVGNADKFDNGSEFSWGVFYENGSGNYRTFNEFNNEFFRGDGSLVYNGGGIAARYENKNGFYTEGSLRAGMLKSDMDNALRDGAGNFYGYESESAYYGAHIGVGKIISLSESSDLDVYGKFFHTYTEGDSFKVANDEFEFDSINSDRLRIGARITSNKENKFSTYYGLAYEYEFNGDADMTAQGLKAPTQSLQGSSVMAEIGFNYQPTPTSPWSFDLNMRGYAGERQGGSFNVQATYTF